MYNRKKLFLRDLNTCIDEIYLFNKTANFNLKIFLSEAYYLNNCILKYIHKKLNSAYIGLRYPQ